MYTMTSAKLLLFVSSFFSLFACCIMFPFNKYVRILGISDGQVLFSAAVLTFGGYDKAEWIILQGRVCSIQCFPWTTRWSACFCSYAHTSRIQGYFTGYLGVWTLGHCSRQQISAKNEGYLFSEGYLFTGFYGNKATMQHCSSARSSISSASAHRSLRPVHQVWWWDRSLFLICSNIVALACSNFAEIQRLLMRLAKFCNIN